MYIVQGIYCLNGLPFEVNNNNNNNNNNLYISSQWTSYPSINGYIVHIRSTVTKCLQVAQL